MPRARLVFVAMLAVLVAACDGEAIQVPPTVTPSGVYTVESGGVERTFYIDVPAGYTSASDPKPLIVAFHGTGGTHELWLDGHYPLRDAVSDGAVLVYPDALPTASGINQWTLSQDLPFFTDLLDFVQQTVGYDPTRVFVTGHSSGAGITHEIGCHHGDRIRAIAPVSGALTGTSCTGAIGVMQIHGSNDTVVPVELGELARRFWVLYNGFELATSGPGAEASCVDYSLGASVYPVQWCVHGEGSGAAAHGWPTFAADAIWAFFSALSPATPGAAPPPGGGNDRAQTGFDTTMAFTVRYPAAMNTPVRGAIVLYEAGTTAPVTAPTAFMSLDFPTGTVAPNEERRYEVPVRFTGFGGTLTFPGTYTVLITIFTEGGGYPMPVSGADLWSLFDWTFSDPNTPIEVPGVLPLELIPASTGT